MEGDDRNIRMAGQRGADLLTDPRQELHHAWRESSLLPNLLELSCHQSGLLGRLHDDGVPGNQGGGGHAAQDREWEIPRCDDHGHAARLVEIMVFFTFHIPHLTFF